MNFRNQSTGYLYGRVRPCVWYEREGEDEETELRCTNFGFKSKIKGREIIRDKNKQFYCNTESYNRPWSGM